MNKRKCGHCFLYLLFVILSAEVIDYLPRDIQNQTDGHLLLESPNYPNEYPANTLVSYVIEAPEDHYIVARVLTLDTQRGQVFLLKSLINKYYNEGKGGGGGWGRCSLLSPKTKQNLFSVACQRLLLRYYKFCTNLKALFYFVLVSTISQMFLSQHNEVDDASFSPPCEMYQWISNCNRIGTETLERTIMNKGKMNRKEKIKRNKRKAKTRIYTILY